MILGDDSIDHTLENKVRNEQTKNFIIMLFNTSGTKYTKFIYILYVRTHYEIKDDFLFFEDLA